MPIQMLMGYLLDAASKPASPALGPALRTFFDLVLAVWPLWVLVGVVGAARLAWRLYRLRRLAQSGIHDIDAMDGHTFETFLGTLFRRLGYRVEQTRYRGDYGADLVVAKGGVKTAVQAKRSGKRVGVKAVQEAVASVAYYKCRRALVVANRDFTRPARELARANGVELWDRDALVARLLEAGGEAKLSAPAGAAAPTLRDADQEAPDGVPSEARCAICGVTVSAKVRDYCLARAKRFGGRVYCFTHQREVRTPLAPERS